MVKLTRISLRYERKGIKVRSRWIAFLVELHLHDLLVIGQSTHEAFAIQLIVDG